MKRSIAFLLAMIMVIGVIPATLLPVLAHGIGVGVDDVQNLSIDNAPNQKVPATVDVDGIADDTAWKSDEWLDADAQNGIWNVTSASNPDFTYRYQLHIDYEFVYGVIEAKVGEIDNGSLQDFTVWINDGSDDATNHYTSKIVLTNGGAGYSIGVYRHGSTTLATSFAHYDYEQALVKSADKDNGNVLSLEFKVLIADVLGKQLTEETKISLTSFVSAKVNDQYLYHPRVDAEMDHRNVDLTTAWPENAHEVTQGELYKTYVSSDGAYADYQNGDHVDAADYINIDGKLSESAWKNFTDYGGTGLQTFKDYQLFDDYQIPDYEVEYSTMYMRWKDPATENIVIPTENKDFFHYHENNVEYKFDTTGHSGDVQFSEGCFNGYTPEHNKSVLLYPFGDGIYEHVCTANCQSNYLNNIPVKFKYQNKSDGTYVYGAMVVSLSIDDEKFYYDTTNGYDTYFKVMFRVEAAEKSGGSGFQIELKHHMDEAHPQRYGDADNVTRVLGENSDIKETGKDGYGNSKLPEGVGAYATRIDANTMVFEWCISYDVMNQQNTSAYPYELGSEMNIILSVTNDTTPGAYVGAGADANHEHGVVATSSPYYNHNGVYDVFNRKNINRYSFDGTDAYYSPALANGRLDAGIFNGLIATDRFINAGYRTPGGADGTTPGWGAIQYFDYDMFISTEYLYGAAIVKKNGYEKGETTLSTSFDSVDMLRIWLNNGTPQYRDSYDVAFDIYLGDNTARFVWPNSRGEYVTYDANGNPTTYSPSSTANQLDKGAENFTSGGQWGTTARITSGTNNVQFIVAPLKQTYYAGALTGNEGQIDGDMVIVEFKIPLELLGISEKYSERTNLGGDEAALTYFISAETDGGGQYGLVSPIPYNKYISSSGDGLEVMPNKLWHTGFKDSNGDSHNYWITTSENGVDGAKFIYTNSRTNQFVIDGLHDENIWNDKAEQHWVNSTSGSWGKEPDVPHMFDYYYRTYVGREYIYGMAEINTTAGENEELDFTLWIKNPEITSTAGANKAFRIVQKGNYAVCYDINGNEIALTRNETRWHQDHRSTYNLEFTEGKVAMANVNGKTYVEFMFSLEGLNIVTHELGENVWSQYGYTGEVNGSAWYPSTDKFYYYWDPNLIDTNNANGKWAENKKNGFEYCVSVTKKDSECNHENTLYYPAVPKAAASGITDNDKFCHLADMSAYASKDKWDATNAYLITPTGYFVPETITIDGNLTDSGWDDDRWIEVVAGINGNLQNPVEDMICATEADYKYQMRIDDEYVYLAMVIDAPASPIRYVDDKDGTVYYSGPNARLWIQSKDKDFKIEIDYNKNTDKIVDKTYTYEDANSFTHLYVLTLANSTSTGEPNTKTFELGSVEQYVPETYVTWEPDNAYHIGADKNITVNVNGDKSTVVTSGTTLRFAKNNMGFHAPYGGNARGARDPLAVLSYQINDGTEVDNINANGKYPTVFNDNNYKSSALYGVTEVVEENSVSARHADGSSEKEYVDKDWYAKPEIKGYVYGNQRGVMTADPTGTKTNVEFRLALSEIGCDDGDDFEYFVQGGTLGRNTDSGYALFYPPITYGFSKTTPDKADKTEGRPYWYWASTGKLVDEAERENMKLCNNYEPVIPIGAMYDKNFKLEGDNESYLAMKFGMLYDADYLRLPRITDENSVYKKATYWDLKEIGMLVGYSDSLEKDVSNLTNDNIDNYNIYRMESDVILNQLKGTNMADYESYVFYAIQLLWPEEVDMKLSYRGFVEYYPSDHMYYDMADKVFGTWTYSTGEDEGQYLGKPLELTNDNNPQSIPKTYTYRPTFYSDVVTRSANMIDFASATLKEDATNLPGKVEIPEIPDSNNVDIVYVPIDNRPINLERVQYQAEAAGFNLILPPEEYYYSTNVDTYSEGKSDQGNPVDLYNWLKDEIYKDGKGGYKYFIISVDQMLSGGLVGSREPFYDTNYYDDPQNGDSIANKDSLKNFGGVQADGTVGVYSSAKAEDEDGYELSEMEVQIIDLLKTIASDPTTHTVYFDTIKRLASTGDYFEMNFGNYGAWRTYGSFARKQLYGSELTIENIVSGYNTKENGNNIACLIDQYTLNYVEDDQHGLNTVDINGNTIHTIQNFTRGTDYYFRNYESFTDTDGTSYEYFKYYGVDATDYQMYMAARERKLRIADALYPTLVAEADTFYIGYDDSKPHTTMQTNDGRYIEEKLLKGADNCFIFSGTDELGMMGMTEVTTHLYGSVDANVEFFGIGKDAPGDDFDTGTLYMNVMSHITGIGGTYNYNNEGDVDILILTRSDYYDNAAGYTEAELEMLIQSAGKLIDRVDANLKANIPTIVIDCAFKDDYLAAMMMQRYRTDTHDADISGRLNQLLCYSQWNTTANSLGTAISNGLSRYTYLKNSPRVTEESHKGATKVNVKAWVKDYGYQSTEVGSPHLSRSKPFNGESTFGKTYNNFWEITEYIMAKLNISPVVIGIDKDGKTIVQSNAYKAEVSNLNWCWDRAFEANFDIDIVDATAANVNYEDYKVTNLALGKTYTTSWASGADASSNLAQDYLGQELTNGVRVYPAASGYGQGSTPYWAGWDFSNSAAANFTDAEGNKYFDITIDLGAVYPIYQVNIDNLSRGLNSSGNAVADVYTPSKIQLLTSTTEDGDYELQRTLTLKGKDSGVYRYYLGTDSKAVETQFVKVRIWKNNAVGNADWFYTSEIEVLGLDATRAEYVDSTGLWYSYSAPDETPYIYGSMTNDDKKRLRMYSNGTTYTTNMVNPDAIFGGFKADVQSGWQLAASADSVDIIVEFDGNYKISQIAVDNASKRYGISTPTYAELYLVNADGTETKLDTNLFITSIYDGDKDNIGDWSQSGALEGTRFTLELKNDVIYVPDDAKLKVRLGRDANSGTDAFIFTGIQVFGRNISHYADVDFDIDGALVKYEFIGDNAEKAGYAQGIVSITPFASAGDATGNYLVYYTDKDGNVLSGYDEIASIPKTGSAVSYEIPAGIMIPEGAVGIAVFDSDSEFLDNAPAMSEAVATAAIPVAKRLTMGTPEAIFGAASDVHMNYEYYGERNAIAKWTEALKFFKANNAEYVVVAGDMVGDAGETEQNKEVTLEQHYKDYQNAITASGFTGNIYEALGNHGALDSDLALFYQYTQTGQNGGEVYPDNATNSPYYYVIKEGDAGEKDNVIVVMDLEMDDTKVSDGPSFSTEQLDWFESVINQFDNANNNVFVLCHAPFLNYGAGDVYKGGGYTDLLGLESTDTANRRFKGILQDHRDVIVMSGHTHLSLYEGANYSNVYNEFAHTVHVPSTCWPRAYDETGKCPAGTDGRYSANTADYGSEAYLVKVYADYIVYTGYNLSTGNIIPAACFMIPTATPAAPNPDDVFEGSGTAVDPYLIQDAQDFLLFTSGFNANVAGSAAEGYGYGKYFVQTADIDLSNIDAYIGTYAGTANYAYPNQGYKSNFAGTYDGRGHTITVDIDAKDSRSVFPYLYGTLVNLKIEGSITSTTTENSGGSAQAVARVRTGASVINCCFDLDLTARTTYGVTYSTQTDSNLYNVFTTGSQNGGDGYEFTITQSTNAAYGDVYYNYDETLSGTSIGTSATVNTVVAAFNNTSSTSYTAAMSILDALGFGIELCEVAVVDGELMFVQ